MLSPEQMDELDVSKMDDEECQRLCTLLREELVKNIAQTGGHLASNLGTVELTVALHRVYHTDRDRLVFDVGHQCYCHKILTGRGSRMNTLRTFGGLSGFPKPSESIHDAFIAGHASNSVSVALGMARARTLLGEDYDVIALIGDGALTGGLSYEGLSDAGGSGEKLLVILNDNGMSIMKNVGGIATHLAQQRLKPQYIRFKRMYQQMTAKTRGGRKLHQLTHRFKNKLKRIILPSSYFEDMGFHYLGPVDGHDVVRLTRVLEYVKGLNEPVVLHVRTVKGKGYPPAEQNPDAFHGVSPFDPANGTPVKTGSEDFSAVFGDQLTRLAEEDRRICAVTAAMQSGTGLDTFAKAFPKRFFDVGIAEGHAVSLCGGMAKQGMIPVFAVYSSFLQRSYDMLIHDIALQHLHAVFCVDRAGLVGADGETHQGVFDLAMLSTVPGITILAPASFMELRSMLAFSIHEVDGPVAIRYPRGGENHFTGDSGFKNTVLMAEGTEITLVTYGTMTGEVLLAAEQLRMAGISPEIIKLNRVHPLDLEPVFRSVAKTGRLLVAEEVIAQGSVGVTIAAELVKNQIAVKKICLLNLGDQFIDHGSVPQLRALCGIDREAIYQQAQEACTGE